MNLRPWKEYHFSPLMLGTVQFGMPYGVANRRGQPTYAEVVQMVAAAIEGGVNGFDTAAAYGASEEVLGRALHELGVAEQVVVVTKIRALDPEEHADAGRAKAAIEQSVDTSRRRLGLDCLPVVLFHCEEDAVHLPVLERLKALGRLRHAGVSCGNVPGAAERFVADPLVSALQLPGSLLDRRHLDSGVLMEAAARGVAVFVRSVYLQGLLLIPEADIPVHLADALPVRRRFERIGVEAGLSPAELAVRYVLSLPGVTSVLTGVETVEQVRENLALFARGPLDAETLQAVHAEAETVAALPERVVTPWMW